MLAAGFLSSEFSSSSLHSIHRIEILALTARSAARVARWLRPFELCLLLRAYCVRLLHRATSYGKESVSVFGAGPTEQATHRLEKRTPRHTRYRPLFSVSPFCSHFFVERQLPVSPDRARYTCAQRAGSYRSSAVLLADHGNQLHYEIF